MVAFRVAGENSILPTLIPTAARWAIEHHYITGDEFAAAIEADRPPHVPVYAERPFEAAAPAGWLGPAPAFVRSIALVISCRSAAVRVSDAA